MSTPITANRNKPLTEESAAIEVTTKTEPDTRTDGIEGDEILTAEAPPILADDVTEPTTPSPTLTADRDHGANEDKLESIATEPASPFRADAAALLAAGAATTAAPQAPGAVTTNKGTIEATPQKQSEDAATERQTAKKGSVEKKSKPAKKKPRVARSIRFLIYLALAGAAMVLAVVAVHELAKSTQTFASSTSGDTSSQ